MHGGRWRVAPSLRLASLSHGPAIPGVRLLTHCSFNRWGNSLCLIATGLKNIGCWTNATLNPSIPSRSRSNEKLHCALLPRIVDRTLWTLVIRCPRWNYANWERTKQRILALHVTSHWCCSSAATPDRRFVARLATCRTYTTISGTGRRFSSFISPKHTRSMVGRRFRMKRKASD